MAKQKNVTENHSLLTVITDQGKKEKKRLDVEHKGILKSPE